MGEELSTKEKVVGIKQTRRAVAKGCAQRVYLACDADSRLTEPLRAMCALANIDVVSDLTMQQLGRACAIDLGTAACAVLSKSIPTV